ncbi:hypothetical protein FD06_GL000909 [Apilactobacillus ozensis DSM 23829 = JCM 17196]|uniref:DUF3021 domain-containing protein n=1 Tax=Apilactobacillus ozensis DSM 23829 = JCM 17196 TaxID=1423781 RepID=A0A0R2AR16_9LACO|nr:DUF3021 family protein [Apilactobacillus ozensis]KRM69736.1 hypothetical protein FD06_GL000909 [Apilactobacillus ozensis DSM 23829 = JCM 17196]
MKKLRVLFRILKEGLIGMMIGSFIEILGIALDSNPNVIHPKSAACYLIFTFFIGVLSEIFLIDSIEYYLEIIMHAVITYLLFYIYNVLSSGINAFKLSFFISYTITFIAIYIFAWIVVIIFWKKDTYQINNALNKRNKR